MARITAREAFFKAKSKRLRTQTLKPRPPANSIRQLSRISENVLNVRPRSDSSSSQFETDSMSSTSTTVTRSARKVSKKEIAKDNKKITDYYPVASRGRENLAMSPISTISHLTTSMALNSTSGRPKRSPKKMPAIQKQRKVEIVTICDTDDEDDIVRSNRLITEKLKQSEKICQLDLKHSIKLSDPEGIKQELTDCTGDADIEIVEVLPPIPLRDHPIYDLDDEN